MEKQGLRMETAPMTIYLQAGIFDLFPAAFPYMEV